MTKAILITAAAIAATLQAQNSFQSQTWMAPPNRAAIPPTEGQSGPVIGKPFSGVETRQTKQVLADGTPANKTSVTKIYRDAEGRTRSEASNRAMLFDAPNHVFYGINGKSCDKHTVKESDYVVIVATDNGSSWSTRGQAQPGKPNQNVVKPNQNAVVEDLGFQVINGISAQGTRQTVTIPADTIGSDHDVKVVNERWYSDALGILIKSSNTDPRFGSTTYELSNINQSTPDLSLFTAPTGCSEFQMPGMR